MFRHNPYALACAAIAAMLIGAPPLLHAALPTNPDISEHSSLSGQLLVATPVLRGSPFDRTVILVAHHDRDGALGIVINRPLDERPIASLVEALGADASAINGSVRVYSGGPVSPDVAFVLHGADYRVEDTLEIDGRVALSPPLNVLRDLGTGKGPHKCLVAFGYAGWGAFQLEDEVARGAWFSLPENAALVFDDDRAKVWDEAMARHHANH